MSDKWVLLVTTGVSSVRKQLESLCGDCLLFVDCSGMTRHDLFLHLRTLSYDILVTYRCPYILPQDIIDCAAILAVNIHPSLLPAYAGLNPWEEMIGNNEKNGGVTVHVLTADVDQGRIIRQESFDLDFSQGLAYNRTRADELAGVMIRNLFTNIVDLKSAD